MAKVEEEFLTPVYVDISLLALLTHSSNSPKETDLEAKGDPEVPSTNGNGYSNGHLPEASSVGVQNWYTVAPTDRRNRICSSVIVRGIGTKDWMKSAGILAEIDVRLSMPRLKGLHRHSRGWDDLVRVQSVTNYRKGIGRPALTERGDVDGFELSAASLHIDRLEPNVDWRSVLDRVNFGTPPQNNLGVHFLAVQRSPQQ